MSADQEHISSALTDLQSLNNLLLELGERVMRAQGGALYPMDFLALAAIKRSLALLSGFCLLTHHRNLACSAALLRLQLDTALRFYASYLVEDPHEFATSILKGEAIRKLKDRKGKALTDRHLVDSLALEFAWIPKVYDATSGYVHFSETHLFSIVDGPPNDRERSMKICLSGVDNAFPDRTYLESIDGYRASVMVLVRYLEGWIFSKDNPDACRQAREGLTKSSSQRPEEKR